MYHLRKSFICQQIVRIIMSEPSPTSPTSPVAKKIKLDEEIDVDTKPLSPAVPAEPPKLPDKSTVQEHARALGLLDDLKMNHCLRRKAFGTF